MAIVHPGTAFAQDAIDPAALQHDVAVRFAAGDYAGVVEATNGVEKALRAKAKDPDFVPRMRLIAELLTHRAVAERALGRFEAAEASLKAAGKTLGDKDVQRIVAMFLRSAGEKAAPAVVPLELTHLQLVDAQLDLVLSLIETDAAPTSDADAARTPGADGEKPAPVEPAPRKAKARGDLRQTFNALLFQARGLRQGLEERLEKAEPAVRSSPTSRALVSLARPMFHTARAALIEAQTRFAAGPPEAASPVAPNAGGPQAVVASGPAPAAGGPPVADASTPPANPASAPPDPVALLTEALEVAEKAMAPVLASPENEDRPAAEAAAIARANYEAALVRAPYLEWRARARIMAGDTSGARADVQAALAERAAAGQRTHPDVVESLVIGGDAALAEAHQTKASGDLASSRAAFEHAVAWLSRARDVASACPGAFDAESPVRQRIDERLASAVEARQSTVATVATTDAVDAAARRILRALGARPASPARPSAVEAAP